MDSVYKFGTVLGDEEVQYQYADVFALEITSGRERLVIAPSQRQVSLLIDLLALVPEPLGILYVLVVPRGNGKAGRYQISAPVSRSEAEGFLKTFQDFFENDARHHIWISSISGSDLLVYDNHNVIYAYGRLSDFGKLSSRRGLNKADMVNFPSPHTHKYNAIFDEDERRLFGYFEWKWFPLQESDD